MRTAHLALLALMAWGCAPQGPQGPAGLQGPQGEIGPKGEDGHDGPEGVDGGDARIIQADTTWSGEELVERIVYVMPGVKLTIEPGTTVTFLPDSGLLVDGSLIADGSPTGEIAFVAGTTFDDTLLGVRIGDQATASTLDNVAFERIDLEVLGGGVSALTWGRFEDAGLRVAERSTAFAVSHVDFTWSGFDGVSIDVADVSSIDIDNVAISGGQTGLYATGDVGFDVSVTDGLVTDVVDGMLIYAPVGQTSVLTLDGVTVQDTGDDGIYTQETQIIASNVLLQRIGRDALQSNDHDVVAQSALRDVTVTEAGYDCIVLTYAVDAERVSVSDCGFQGVRSSVGESRLVDVSIDTVKNNGIWLDHGLVSHCEVANATASAVIVYGSTVPTTIEYSALTDNGSGVSVFGDWSSDSRAPVLVQFNNITGSSQWALSAVGLVDGNYIADNKGFTGPDLTEAGTVDGVHDVDTDQIRWADAVTNAHGTARTDAGLTQ